MKNRELFNPDIYFGPSGNNELRINFQCCESNRCDVTHLHMVQTGQCQTIKQQNSLKTCMNVTFA